MSCCLGYYILTKICKDIIIVTKSCNLNNRLQMSYRITKFVTVLITKNNDHKCL